MSSPYILYYYCTKTATHITVVHLHVTDVGVCVQFVYQLTEMHKPQAAINYSVCKHLQQSNIPGFELLHHTSYSPDSAPSDFDLLPCISGKRAMLKSDKNMANKWYV